MIFTKLMEPGMPLLPQIAVELHLLTNKGNSTHMDFKLYNLTVTWNMDSCSSVEVTLLVELYMVCLGKHENHFLLVYKIAVRQRNQCRKWCEEGLIFATLFFNGNFMNEWFCNPFAIAFFRIMKWMGGSRSDSANNKGICKRKQVSSELWCESSPLWLLVSGLDFLIYHFVG